jgi:predicted transposase YbfD/YdcC
VKTSEGEAELTVARTVLAQVPLQGRLVTGDALHCQQETCRQIRLAGGDYLFFVKRNQPQLYADIATLFAEPPPGEGFATAEQMGRHADRWEVRRLWASTALAGYVHWPGTQQVGQVERVVLRRGQTTTEARYFVTSHGPEVGAGRLLAAARGHWTIENRLHYPRDVSMHEDASQIRTGAAPQVMAALRNVVLNLLRHLQTANIAARLRAIAWEGSALRILGWAPT